MIVKVQRPLATNLQPGQPAILVYSEGREHMSVMREEDLPGWLRSALKDEPKLFATATHTRQGWSFSGLAGQQPW